MKLKFVTNSFSLLMQTLEDMDFSSHMISIDEFEALKYGAISHVGNETLANILGVKYNPNPVYLREGDCILVAHLVGGKLPHGAEELPDNVGLKFYLVEIKECNAPLLREEEIYGEI